MRKNKKDRLSIKIIYFHFFLKSLKNMACVMEKQICLPLTNFRTNKTFELNINQKHYQDFHEILEDSHEIVREAQNEYSKVYNNQGVTPDFHFAHNEYLLELAGANSLYSKYQHTILPQLLQVKIFIRSN